MDRRIIIVGGGAAGLSAAVYLAEHGGRAVVLEKNPKLGGNGIFAEVMFGLNTEEQEKRGITCDLDGYYRLSMEHSHYKNNARLLRRMLEHTAENMDWLCVHGLSIAGLQEESTPGLGAATHYTEGMHTGRETMNVLRAYCEQSDRIELHTRVSVKRLIVDGQRVTGVQTAENGEEVNYLGDAVIVACGGCSGNRALIHRINPGVDAGAFGHLRGIQMNGDGILMAEQAGAEILSDGCLENAGPTFLGNQSLMGLVTKRYAVWLNRQGRRFADESVGDNFVYGCNAVYSQPGHVCYVLLDQKMVEQAASGPVDFLAGPAANAKGMAGLSAAIAQEVENGRAAVSDSLDGIAARLNIPNLRAEISEYNRFCEQGSDPIFLKPKALLQPLEQGPYLCIRCGVDYILTHGGIRVDEYMQVQRADGGGIPGLYAAGADISGIDAAGYQVSMGGHSFGFSLTGGRLAAQSALDSTT